MIDNGYKTLIKISTTFQQISQLLICMTILNNVTGQPHSPNVGNILKTTHHTSATCNMLASEYFILNT